MAQICSLQGLSGPGPLGRRLGRRIAAVLALLGLLASCGANPRLAPSTASSSRPPQWQQAATAEAALAVAYAKAARVSVVPACDPWCAAAGAMHAAHAQVLTQPDPWGGFVPATPETSPDKVFPDAATALKQLQDAAAAALAADEAGLVASSPGNEALLWSSLVATAKASLDWATNPLVAAAPVAGPVVPSRVTVPATADALASALAAVNALGYGLAASLGDATDPQLRADMSARISAANPQRTALEAEIRDAGAAPVPPSLSYPLPQTPGTDDAARANWAQLESNLADAYIRLGAAKTGDAAVASACQANLAAAAAAGQPITWWPGWG